MDGRMMDGWVDTQMDGQVGEWMNEQVPGWRCTLPFRLWVVQGITNVWPGKSTSRPCPGWDVYSTLISTIQLTANTLNPWRQLLENTNSSRPGKSDRVLPSTQAGFGVLKTEFPKAHSLTFLFSFCTMQQNVIFQSSILSQGFTVSCDLFWALSSWKIVSTQ